MPVTRLPPGLQAASIVMISIPLSLAIDTTRHVACSARGISSCGTQYVDNPVRVKRTDLRVHIDHGKARLLSIHTVEVDRTLRLGLAGYFVLRIEVLRTTTAAAFEQDDDAGGTRCLRHVQGREAVAGDEIDGGTAVEQQLNDGGAPGFVEIV